MPIAVKLKKLEKKSKVSSNSQKKSETLSPKKDSNLEVKNNSSDSNSKMEKESSQNSETPNPDKNPESSGNEKKSDSEIKNSQNLIEENATLSYNSTNNSQNEQNNLENENWENENSKNKNQEVQNENSLKQKVENPTQSQNSPKIKEKYDSKNSKNLKTPLIQLENLEKYYVVGGEKQMVIKGINLSIWAGETVAILGKSGSGKSTLLNILGLLDAPTGGTYSLNGYNVNTLSGDFLATTRARTFGFIFQQFNLLPKLSVLENVMMPIRYTRDAEKWKNRLETAHDLLKMVEIDEQSEKLPKLLSGGQQQRVAIARSLVNQPKVVIGDEPTGALDSKTANQIIKQIFQLNKELGVTVIIVTHDEDLAYRCGRVIRLVDGLIVDEETPLESLE